MAQDGMLPGIFARVTKRAKTPWVSVLVLATGWALGGTVGVGTVLYALAIGPLAHRFIPLLAIAPATRSPGEPQM